jgi:hypothetical protein
MNINLKIFFVFPNADEETEDAEDEAVIIQTPHKPWNTPRTSIMRG